MRSPNNKWYIEPVLPNFLHQLELKAVRYEGETALQRVEIIETDPLGLTLVLDGKTQSARADEFIYHEALVHPALIAHPNPRNVLIAGGAEGAVLREVLAHRSVQSAVMVDMDAELVAICREHLPEWHQGAFEDPRTHLVFGDARKFLQDHAGQFDVIIVDVTDPQQSGESYLLFTEAFYRLAKERLNPDGYLVTQAGPTSFELAGLFCAVASTVGSVFGRASPYCVDLLSFGSNWGFVLAGPEPFPALTPLEVDRRITGRVTRELRFYDGTTHQGAFSLPKWLRRQLAAESRVITDTAPVFLS